MKYAADVMLLTAQKVDQDRVNFAGFEAADNRDAVRKIADQAARRIYGDEGQSSWIEPDPGRDEHYLSFIGIGAHRNGDYQLKGVTISIHIWPVR